ncbi:MAG: hypothetical protein ACP5DX_05915 [Paracoccaceae bacterium]
MTVKPLTAGLLALILAASPMTAAPARADAEDVAITLLGIAALVALANELDDDGRKRKNKRYRHDHSYTESIPGHCVLRLETHRGSRDVVTRQCLKSAGLRRDLPDYCEAPRASRLLGREAYALDCLRAEGYRVAGRH